MKRRGRNQGRAVIVGVAACVLVGVMMIAAVASAESKSGNALHNARYCEILELKGGPPDGRVVVWNTIGLNDCPAAKWDAFDAGELATELGDTLVVLNGPRHFLMDSATARTGRVRSFHGLRMRRVATIPIRTAADLVRTPYTERTVDRTNTWSWKSGRRVYELLAPDGSNYVMQSYSQIVDPSLKIGELSTLSDRLDLPPGWRLRTRRLKQGLTLKAKGSATIVQDDLMNTYQREPGSRNAPKPERRRVDLTGATKEVGGTLPGPIEDRGTITGKPFGDAKIKLLVTLNFSDSTATGTFRIRNDHGTALGTVDMHFTISGGEITFTGTAGFTGGNGRYRGIKGEDLKAYDHNTLDGQNGTIALKGFATY